MNKPFQMPIAELEPFSVRNILASLICLYEFCNAFDLHFGEATSELLGYYRDECGMPIEHWNEAVAKFDTLDTGEHVARRGAVPAN